MKHLLIALSLAFLSLGSAAVLPGRLKGDLAEVARGTDKLMREDKLLFFLNKWQHFVDEWTPRVSKIAEVMDALEDFGRQREILLFNKPEEQLNIDSKGSYDKLKRDLITTKSKRLFDFEDSGRTLISKSQDSTGHLNAIVRYFNLFVRSKPNYKEQHFKNLYKYLTLDGAELDDWLSLDILGDI